MFGLSGIQTLNDSHQRQEAEWKQLKREGRLSRDYHPQRAVHRHTPVVKGKGRGCRAVVLAARLPCEMLGG